MSTAKLLDTAEIKFIPIDIIVPNPYQPRRFFEKSQLEDLSNSIKEYGVLSPISVRLINGTSYELVAGERRLRASKMAGMETIPSIIININDQDSAIIALIENLQRQNINYIEEAEGFQNLISDYGFTQEELAKRVGKNQSTVANKLRLLKLTREIQNALLQNDLSERHARALLKLSSEELQLEAIKKIVKDSLTVKKTEELIEKMHMQTLKKGESKNIKSYIKDIRLFTNSIKQAVDLMNSSGVETVYEFEETSDGCFISIAVSYS